MKKINSAIKCLDRLFNGDYLTEREKREYYNVVKKQLEAYEIFITTDFVKKKNKNMNKKQLKKD